MKEYVPFEPKNQRSNVLKWFVEEFNKGNHEKALKLSKISENMLDRMREEGYPFNSFGLSE